MKRYKLLKAMPGLDRGAIFEHRDYDDNFPDRGNNGCGVMILCWIDGDCQQSWCGETFILPGQLADNKVWFKKVDDRKCKCCGSIIYN